MFSFARTSGQSSSSYTPVMQLLANLSICVCICSYKLWSYIQLPSSSQPIWKRLFTSRRQEMPALSEIQETLDRGVEIYERLKRLDRRIKGEEPACESILIVKEHK